MGSQRRSFVEEVGVPFEPCLLKVGIVLIGGKVFSVKTLNDSSVQWFFVDSVVKRRSYKRKTRKVLTVKVTQSKGTDGIVS